MHALRTLALCAAVLSSPALLSADEPKKSGRPGPESSSKEKEKKPDYAKLLVGKWVRTDGPYAGTVVAFDKNGTYTTTTVTKLNGKPIVMPGTWKVDAETLAQTVRDRGYVTDTKVTILSLTETEFRFKNKAGQEAAYERVTEKDGKGKDKKGKK